MESRQLFRTHRCHPGLHTRDPSLRLAPAFADGWIPATSAGMTCRDWRSGST